MRIALRFVCLVAGASLLATSAVGQEGPVTFEFSFSNPGARAMGLGGAFAALADDATAAFANPAGLVQLLEPEISLEGRSWSYDIPFVTGGRASGIPTGIGMDAFSALRFDVSSSRSNGLSYLSFVYPGEKWSVAAYRQRWANFSVNRQIDSLFGVVDGELERAGDIVASTELEVTNNGVVGAYEIVPGLSVGIGLVYFEAFIESRSTEFAADDDAFFEPNAHDPEFLDTTYFLGGEDSGLSVHTGFSYRPNDRWSFGGYFREGPDLTMQVTEITGPGNDSEPAGTIELDAATPLSLPTVYGLGAAFRALDGALTVSVEWDHVGYAAITDSLDAAVSEPGKLFLTNGHELHAGGEYIFSLANQIVAVRLGAWRDPAHGLNASESADLFEQAVFDGGSSEIHFSGGAGIVIQRVQVDFGLDLSETADLFSLSVVYRF